MNNTSPPAAVAADTVTPDVATPENSAAAALDIGDELNQLKDIKAAAIDSAELATRAAGLAVDAGGQLRTASRELITSQLQQRKFLVALLVACGSLMLVAGGVFGALAWRMQARIAQLDDMVLAVGKRVAGMDASMESVGAVQEALQTLLVKQEAVAGLQVKIDSRLDEAMKDPELIE